MLLRVEFQLGWSKYYIVAKAENLRVVWQDELLKMLVFSMDIVAEIQSVLSAIPKSQKVQYCNLTVISLCFGHVILHLRLFMMIELWISPRLCITDVYHAFSY